MNKKLIVVFTVAHVLAGVAVTIQISKWRAENRIMNRSIRKA
jgi:hypothetical protein